MASVDSQILAVVTVVTSAVGSNTDKKCTLAIGDVVVIQSSERNRNCWPLGTVEELIEGRDGVVRCAKLRAGRSHLERSIQHLYPLELSCDKENLQGDTTPLNPTALVF